MKALLSIKPEFAEKIFSGEKCFEFRKTAFSQEVTTIVVYATAPVGRIVGEFEVARILEDAPHPLWQKTKCKAGISAKFFFDYFKGRKKAIAIEVSRPKKYIPALDPYASNKKFHPPQSFRYLP